MHTKSTSKKIADSLICWIREYATKRIDSYLIDKQINFPDDVYSSLGSQGFFGMHVSRKYGGLELDTYDILRVIEQIAAIDLTICIIVIECIQGAHTLEKYATESMKSRYLPQLAHGHIFTAGAMTESEAGSNPRGMKSVAIPENDTEWLLNGSKRWVGMGALADVIAIYVQQLDKDNTWLGMSGFLVPSASEGLEIGPESLTMGIRGFPKNTIYMNNIKVSVENMLGKPGDGMEIAQDNMMYIRFCLAAASIGTMKHCTQLMYRYAERRNIATGKLSENPLTLVRISEMTAIIDALDNFIYLIADFFDKDPAVVPEEMFVVGKILGSECLGWIVDLVVQTLGARGYEEASGVSKIFRDARAFRIFEGPSEALNMYIGSRVLEENARLAFFVCEILKQSQLFDEIKSNINQVHENCLTNKNCSFLKPFTRHYWSQSLVGEIISHGLILCAIEYSITMKYSEDLHRAKTWARHKYNSVVQGALLGSLGEKVLIDSQKMQEVIYKYTDAIGNIEQNRKTQDVSIDCLLKNNYEGDISKNNLFTELKSHQQETLESNEIFDDVSMIATQAERQQLLHEWNNIENATICPNICVHELFEDQVTKNPESIAIVYQDTSLTYRELNVRANRLAFFLRKKGVSSNTLVAIYMERSLEMIVGLLGILKAGGAYLPVDRHYPLEAIKFMFNDSGAKIVLSHSKLKQAIPFLPECIILYDDIGSDLNDETIPSQASPNDVCYAIYTSGSSGQPKGVMLPHKALTNLIIWHREKIQAKRNVLQFTSLNFDMSFLEIFSAFSSGGILTIISEEDRINPNKFSSVVKNNNIQQLMLPVSFLKNLASSSIDKNNFRQVKEIIVAGEQVTITPEILSFFKHIPSCRFLNYYGPSETHVVTSYEFPRMTEAWLSYPPIGRAISNTKVLILDEEMRVVTIGVIGEIYIGGVALARGYINRNDLTEARFINDPWGVNKEDKLYKTGDYGKFLPDGNILFTGRKDNQVKIRGFRIELHEIDSHIIKFPGIQEAIVIAKNDRMANKYLEAFLVTITEPEDDLFYRIITFLKSKLPSYMIPSRFHVIDKMPLTSSGKINRLTLENHESATKLSSTFIHTICAVTATEKKLVIIMEEFFKTHVGVNYSFTSIGGNSLLAMQIVSRIRDTFFVEIPAFSVISDASIAETAKRIDLLLVKD